MSRFLPCNQQAGDGLIVAVEPNGVVVGDTAIVDRPPLRIRRLPQPGHRVVTTRGEQEVRHRGTAFVAVEIGLAQGISSHVVSPSR